MSRYLRVVSSGPFDVDKGILLEKKFGIHIAGHPAVRLDDLLQFHFNEIVEGVDVLLDQAFDFEEGREEVPLVLGRVDRVGEVLVVVEGL